MRTCICPSRASISSCSGAGRDVARIGREPKRAGPSTEAYRAKPIIMNESLILLARVLAVAQSTISQETEKVLVDVLASDLVIRRKPQIFQIMVVHLGQLGRGPSSGNRYSKCSDSLACKQETPHEARCRYPIDHALDYGLMRSDSYPSSARNSKDED